MEKEHKGLCCSGNASEVNKRASGVRHLLLLNDTLYVSGFDLLSTLTVLSPRHNHVGRGTKSEQEYKWVQTRSRPLAPGASG
ncbi:hypothetical protein AMELA_G00167740 [Ameiurus melas]|uniref:Uncharacterized protein n=1 Tax=Ameiurus melas TaxID=219545 RepID=A0A7J6ADX9_AMEME|nr:hypothetical protein AMELA_G00167740 [Ameiurus melas]